MTTTYGSVANSCWKAQLDYTASSSNTSYSVATEGGICLTDADSIQTGDGVDKLGSIKVETSATSQTAASKTWATTNDSETSARLSKTFTWTRTHAAQTVTVSSKVTVTTCQKWKGSSHASISGNSTASATITIPAKPSYAVKFNANGGSGAPSQQTKWYGESLTLSATKPTRSGYTFKGWNTKADGTGTSYAAGGSYTGNAALALYAQWSLNYAAPTLRVTSAYRADSTGAASDEGTYAVVKASFSCFGTYHPSSWSCSVNGVSSTSPTYTSGSSSSASGSVRFLVAAAMDPDTAYTATVTLKDSSGNSGSTSTATRGVPTAFFPIDASPTGGVGIACSAPASGLEVGCEATFDEAVTARGGVNGVDPSAIDASNVASGTLAAARIPNLAASKVTSGTLALARGGTASDNTARAINTVFAGPSSGSAGSASWRKLAAADLPTVTVAKGGTGATTALEAKHNLMIGSTTALASGLMLTKGGTVTIANLANYCVLACTLSTSSSATSANQVALIVRKPGTAYWYLTGGADSGTYSYCWCGNFTHSGNVLTCVSASGHRLTSSGAAGEQAYIHAIWPLL